MNNLKNILLEAKKDTDVKNRLAAERFTGVAGAGMAKYTCNGLLNPIDLEIDYESCKVFSEPGEVIQDMVIIAINEAQRKVNEFLTRIIAELP